MPLRPDLPSGLNLSRRATTPVKLPKMSFPLGVFSDQAGQAPEPAETETAATAPEATIPVQAQAQAEAPQPQQAAPPAPAVPMAPVAQAARVIVYGRSGCQACVDAIQDLIDRQMSFVYYDVSRDAKALAHLQAICGNEPMVPVIIQVGFGGA